MTRRYFILLTLLVLLTLAGLSISAGADKGPISYTPIVVPDVTEVFTGDLPIDSPFDVSMATFTEGFEGSWPAAGWQIRDNSSSDGGEYLWGKRNCKPLSGSYSIWSVGGGQQGTNLGCSANYPNNVTTWAVYGPFDLTGVSSASVDYHIRGRTESGSGCPWDYIFAGVSTDGDSFSGTRRCGEWPQGLAGNSYSAQSIDLANYAGLNRVWIGFAFVSDGSNTDIGMMIDDVTFNGIEPAKTYDHVAYLPLAARHDPPGSVKTLRLYPQANFTLGATPLAQRTQITILPATPQRDWTYTLTSDIASNEYAYNVTLYNVLPVQPYFSHYTVSFILQHNGTETVLATSGILEALDTAHYVGTLRGIDPTAVAGDKLIFRIQHVAGAFGGAYIGGETESRVKLFVR